MWGCQEFLGGSSFDYAQDRPQTPLQRDHVPLHSLYREDTSQTLRTGGFAPVSTLKWMRLGPSAEEGEDGREGRMVGRGVLDSGPD